MNSEENWEGMEASYATSIMAYASCTETKADAFCIGLSLSNYVNHQTGVLEPN